MKSSRRITALLVLATAAGAAPISSVAQQNGTTAIESEATSELHLAADAPNITPTDVYARMLQVRSGIELVRFVMGGPKIDGAVFTVEDVAPHEVYFQAITMYRKANRLSFEQTREVRPVPESMLGDASSEKVLAIVDAALERINHVRERLGINTVPATQPPDASKTPTDVFLSIVQSNRQLNLLLEENFAPADVFQQVTLAVGYAARLRAYFPGDRIPEAPERVVGKEPVDVYRRLIECFTLIRSIAIASGLDVLELKPHDDYGRYVNPSDVYDIAALLVSELAFIHSQLDGAKPPRPAFYPGRKFPSDVYQRAGVLQAQLRELGEFVADQPNWLRRAKAGQ